MEMLERVCCIRGYYVYKVGEAAVPPFNMRLLHSTTKVTGYRCTAINHELLVHSGYKVIVLFFDFA